MSATTRSRQTAEEVIGPVTWDSDSTGFCRCPGEQHHTTPTQDSHCQVYLEGAPHLHCFHNSCQAERDAAVATLRERLGQFPRLQGSRVTRGVVQPFNADDARKVASNIQQEISIEWLESRSPIEVSSLTPADVLTHLFKPEEQALVFIGTQRSHGLLWPKDARKLREVSHPEGAWFQNQPVDGQWRTKRNGAKTRRSAECVADWRHIVIESDVVPEPEWLKILVQLPFAIYALYSSGGKSVHALAHLGASNKEDWQQRLGDWKRVLIRLGADAQSLSAVRNTRLPQAHRGGRLQRLYYLNPAPTETPIHPTP